MPSLSAFRVAARFLRGSNVVPIGPKKPKGPLQTIHGRKYVLSDYWTMSGEIEEMGSPEGEAGGAKLIDTGGNRFRYLWLFDTDKKILAMWRHSDGDEKYHSRESQAMRDIFALERRGQLNRVTHEEFVQVDREMKSRADATLKSLKEWSLKNQSDLEKQAGEILDRWFEKNIQPTLERRLNELDQGVKPLGFKVNPAILEHRSEVQQAKMWLITKSLERLDQEAAYKLVSDEVGYDAYEPPNNGDGQAVQWALADFVERVYDKFKD